MNGMFHCFVFSTISVEEIIEKFSVGIPFAFQSGQFAQAMSKPDSNPCLTAIDQKPFFQGSFPYWRTQEGHFEKGPSGKSFGSEGLIAPPPNCHREIRARKSSATTAFKKGQMSGKQISSGATREAVQV